MRNSYKKASAKVVSAGVSILVLAGNAMAGSTPTVPATPLEADYAVFDYVFAGVIGVGLVFMLARRAKGFIR